MESLTAILPLLGSLLGVLLTGIMGLVAYSWQENAKRQTDLAQRRQKLYEDLNSSLFGLLLATGNDNRRIILAEIEKGWLFASDEVLAALFKFIDTFDQIWIETHGQVLAVIKEDEQIRQQIEQGFAEIFLAMRQDLRSTKISDSLAKNYMHFYRFGLLDAAVESKQAIET